MSSFTPSQLEAIAARGNVLVTAGAGTGKTRTLVERVVRLITEEGRSIENMLLVTFTEAASAEMRRRIREALLQRQCDLAAQDPPAERLAQQVALLDTAHISTLHGFCLRLVRQHFHDLGLDPQFIVLDERQTVGLIEESLDTLFEEEYASQEPEAEVVRQLIRRYGRGSDGRIRELILKIHRFTQTLPDPEGWLAAQVQRFQAEAPSEWREWLPQACEEWRQAWLPALRPGAAHVENIARCVRALETREMPEALTEIRAADEAEWIRGTKDKFRKPLKKFWEESKFLHSLIARPAATAGRQTNEPDAPDPLAEDWLWARVPMLALLYLTFQFGELFSKAKREVGGVDFSDLEQFALRLLRDPDTGQPTALARQWQDRFDEICVDEYQDINEAQDSIVAALSRSGASSNRFMVGDLKQSIYRFRLANPSIFRRYEQAWRKEPALGRCIALSDNFRSREGILAFVNRLFSSLLRPAIGGVAYGEDAALRFGNPRERAALSLAGQAQDSPPQSRPPCVEFHLIAKETDADDENGAEEKGSEGEDVADLLGAEREARLAARCLRELKEAQAPVWDDRQGSFRPVDWGDMVVLMRSPSGRAESFAKEFGRQGVPLQSERGGFFACTEVSDLLSLLQLLDNPLQDVPLLAVLRSPLVGLSLDELAEIRLILRKDSYWTTLNRWHEVKPADQGALWNKVDLFLRRFGSWRRLARESSLSVSLETSLQETHYEAVLEAGERGPDRVLNVRRLLSLARQFDPFQRQGLFRFLRFVAAQQEAEVDESPAPLPTSNAVRLMSIHKSKGLEFPVVVLAGLGTRFNRQDLGEDILLSEAFGLCPKVVPPESMNRYPSLAHWLGRQREWKERLGEEMRLLYVAMTRARDRLFLIGSASKHRNHEPLAEIADLSVDDRDLLSANSMLDWLLLLLPALTRPQPDREQTQPRAELLTQITHTLSSPLLQADRTLAPEAEPQISKSADPAQIEALRRRLQWRYSRPAATSEPAKASVSALRRRAVDALDDESRRLFEFRVGGADAAPPLADETGLNPAEVGLAHHRFLELVRLDRVDGEISLRNEAARIVAEGGLDAAAADTLDFADLAAFWQSPLGRRLCAQPRANVHREIPFTARFTPDELLGLGIPLGSGDTGSLPHEFIVVQGAVDLAIIDDRQIVIVDFKTDRVRPREIPDKARLYAAQLNLYALALQRIYRRPATECWLHFVRARQAVRVPLILT